MIKAVKGEEQCDVKPEYHTSIDMQKSLVVFNINSIPKSRQTKCKNYVSYTFHFEAYCGSIFFDSLFIFFFIIVIDNYCFD